MILEIKKACLKKRYGDRPAWRRFYLDPDTDKPIEETTFTVLDTETTGLNPRKEHLISIGSLKIKRGLQLDLSTTFHRLIRVEEVKRESVEIHGITPGDLERLGDPPDRVIEDFLDYAKGSVVVGFNVEFDRRFIERYTLEIFGIPFPFYRVDVLSLWKRRDGQIRSLEEVARSLGIPTAGMHSAIDDAYITALVFLKIVHPLRHKPVKVLPLVI